MAKSFKEMLVESGQELEFQSGGKAPDHLVDREIKWEPHPRIAKLKGIYMDSLSSTNNEFPYWYTREYFQGDNEVPVIRSKSPEMCILPFDTGYFSGGIVNDAQRCFYAGLFSYALVIRRILHG